MVTFTVDLNEARSINRDNLQILERSMQSIRCISTMLLGLTVLGSMSSSLAFADNHPGRIEAEDFVAHFDTDTVNEGNATTTTGVDVQVTGDTDGAFNIGWTADGEWLEYDVNVPEDGIFDLRARVAAAFSPGALEFAVDGQTVATIDVGDTGGFQRWSVVTQAAVKLEQGDRRVRVTWRDGANINLNWFEFVEAGSTSSPAPIANGFPRNYEENLALIKASPVRNSNHDNSTFRNTASRDLVTIDHFGPRIDYVRSRNLGHHSSERDFPFPQGGQFRTTCEFSHFSYDDPLIFPGKPGAAPLRVYFGNTDVNAFSTHDSLINSGSSTCNGQELNRTAYWVPAMFDADGNVRIPERVQIYYKGEGLTRGRAKAYPDGAAMIALTDPHKLPASRGGAPGKFSFTCTDQFSGAKSPASNTIPNCDGNRFGNRFFAVLEMDVKFPQCWNGQDPTDWNNFFLPRSSGWYRSDCQGGTNLPNMEYQIAYRIERGENTRGWYLASDVDPRTFQRSGAPGNTIRGYWWGGWHKQINQMWVDNCTNFRNNQPSGCGNGYLTNGGPDGNSPRPGQALKLRPNFDGPVKVPARTLYQNLCRSDRPVGRGEDAAHCVPGGVASN